MVTCEVCVADLASVHNAVKGGCHRLELCSALEVGGLTPSHAFVERVIRDVSTPVHVLVRPRPGGFVYSQEELEIMQRDIEIFKDIGCHGIVVGVVRDGGVDIEAMEVLMAVARPLQVTYHRAFDMLSNPVEGMNDLIELGVDYVLTSGQADNAQIGAPIIAELHLRFGDAITIIAGGGITRNNVKRILAETGLTQFHGSFAAASQTHAMEESGDAPLANLYTEADRRVTSEKIVRDCISESRKAEPTCNQE